MVCAWIYPLISRRIKCLAKTEFHRFLSKGRNCHLAEPTGVWEIQANSQISVPWANWQDSTGFYADGKEENERPIPYSVTNPEVVAQGLVSSSLGLNSPNLHAANKSTAAGTSIAIAYVDSIWDVTMENLVVISIAGETPFERIANYEIPDLAACESCICVTGLVLAMPNRFAVSRSRLT